MDILKQKENDDMTKRAHYCQTCGKPTYFHYQILCRECWASPQECSGCYGLGKILPVNDDQHEPVRCNLCNGEGVRPRKGANLSEGEV